MSFGVRVLLSGRTWSLEPLVLPERTVEAQHLRFSGAYREHLLEMFKGVLALLRETHINALLGFTRMFKAPVYIRPQLTVEPLATCYRRRAESYGFVKQHLSRIVGRDALSQLRRHTAFGPVQAPLLDELDHIEQIFWGAYVTSLRELGLSTAIDLPGGGAVSAEVCYLSFRTWQQQVAGDMDLAADCRMMVPVCPEKDGWKVWLFLCWSARKLTVSFFEKPAVRVRDADGNPVDVWTEFGDSVYSAATPVFAEHYTSRLMDREEFRAHCDQYCGYEEILAHLDN